ncbi:hypothetical protein ABGB16_06440 [Micromonospora sp. B11E3]|uniref:hypothetical protein n=1 Tax=Micromonospora sp. B11E3 TaxID=3153562 RepID=UPI00325DEEBC
MKAPAEERGESTRRAAPAPPPRTAVDPEPSTTEVRGTGPRPLSPAVAQRLQSAAGNRAVAALVAQRRAAAPRTPAARSGAGTAARRPGSGGAARGPAVSAQRAAGPASSGAVPTSASSAAAPGIAGPVEAAPVQRLETDAGPVHQPGPQADPKFATLKADVRGKQQLLSAHPPAQTEAAKAQGAAKPPQDDKEAQGKAANAEKMNAAKPGEFDKAAFVRAVNEAIAAQAPKNLDEADKFGDSGKADAVKGQVQGQVTDGKKASANAIETTTKAPPDTSKAVDKQVTPLVADKPPGTPGTPDPAKAVPDKAPPAATDFSDGPQQVDQQMADAQVTEEQLARSNEPEFTGALKEKNAAEQHAATAPGQVRATEAQTLAGAKAAAGQAGAAAMTALATDRKQAGAQVGAGKEEAKSADEAKRAKVTAVLQKVFDATKKDVEDILSGLDKKVDDKFSAGEKAARDAFTAEHKRRMDEYKDKRYSGIVGKGRWIKDKFAGLPEEANQIFVVARKGYVDRMQQVISGVADVIGAELTRAKQRIAAGRNELQAEVRKLPADLQAIGKEAAGEFAGKFDELTEQVDSKGTELVQTLASKYNEALKSVDEEIAAEKEKNKGLVAKAVDAVAGVIKTIMQLKDMLMGVLAKAAQAVMAIIKDPIGFLGNLVSAVGAGLRAFLANIGEHLKKGLVGWVTGAMAGAGLELPAKFDLRGIVLMIGSLLGLTWASIRGRIIQKGVPEPAMSAVESSVPLVQKVQAQGLGGMWEEIQDKVGDLKANLFSKISEYLIPTVLMAGITWIISLLNPASAFVRAVKMIIDFVTFIVTQGAQILEFVNSVLDAIIAIAGGGTGGVPALIEKALARSVPVLIGVLAAVLGIGGIAQKVQKFFKALSKPVMKAVDWVVGKIVGLGKKLWAKIKARAGRRANGKNTHPDHHESDGEYAKKLARAERELPRRYENLFSQKPSRRQVASTNRRWKAEFGIRALSARTQSSHLIVVARATEKQVGTAHQVTRADVERVVDSIGLQLHLDLRNMADELQQDSGVSKQYEQIKSDWAAGQGRSFDAPRARQSPAAESLAIKNNPSLYYDRYLSSPLDTPEQLAARNQLGRSIRYEHDREHISHGPGDPTRERRARIQNPDIRQAWQDAQDRAADEAVKQGRTPPARDAYPPSIPGLMFFEGFPNDGSYAEVKNDVAAIRKATGLSDAQIAGAALKVAAGQPLDPTLTSHPHATKLVNNLTRLLLDIEPGRHTGSLTTNYMSFAAVAAGEGTIGQAIDHWMPMTDQLAGQRARATDASLVRHQATLKRRTERYEKRLAAGNFRKQPVAPRLPENLRSATQQEMVRKEKAATTAYVYAMLKNSQVVYQTEEQFAADIRKLVEEQLTMRLRKDFRHYMGRV